MATGITQLHAASNKPVGKNDVTHFSARANFESVPGSTASDSVFVQYRAQGKTEHQVLDITVKNLDPTGAYQLELGFLGVVEPVRWDVDPDDSGSLFLRYREVISNGKTKKLGKNQVELPPDWPDLSGLRSVSLVMLGDSAAVPPVPDVTVLSADLTAGKFNYLLKRDLSNDTLKASLLVNGNQTLSKVNLTVKGLEASTEYAIAVNEDASPDYMETTDSKGVLKLSGPLEPAVDILGLWKLELLKPIASDPITHGLVIGATLP